MHGSSDRGPFMKNFRFDTICNSTKGTKSYELQRFICACGSHHVKSDVITINAY